MIFLIEKLSLDHNYLIDADCESEQKMITYLKILKASVASFAISLFTCSLHFCLFLKVQKKKIYFILLRQTYLFQNSKLIHLYSLCISNRNDMSVLCSTTPLTAHNPNSVMMYLLWGWKAEVCYGEWERSADLEPVKSVEAFRLRTSWARSTT